MIRLIAAVDSKNGIAKDGNQPFFIPEDLKRFHDLTISYGANILMGYKTFASIGHALSGRNNYVISHSHADESNDKVTIVSDLEKFLKDFKLDLWVVGGAGAYDQTIDSANELYLTKINHDFNCDQFFPAYEDNFNVVSDEGPKEYKGISFSYQILKRNN